jgi:hypothetical protein
MVAALIARISPQHYQRLAWFEEHAGSVSPFPSPLEDGLLLATRPKGIYKPRDLPYALSIRINIDSPYPDGQVLPRPDGSWCLSYHQENQDPHSRDNAYTNRGLMRCIQDRVPVGVLRERRPAGRQTQYDVLGLAMPVRWYDGYFLLESLGPGGFHSGDTLADVLEATAEGQIDQDDENRRRPGDHFSAKLRTYRQIVARRGNAEFRAALLVAYGGRCAVTDCDVEPLLEAVQLSLWGEPDVLGNGLLLRADIHTLFDLGLVAFEPETRRVVVSRVLEGTEYRVLASRHLIEPSIPAQRPTRAVLDQAWTEFAEAEALRTSHLAEQRMSSRR